MPYTIVGTRANPVSSIHAVVNGSNDNQNSSARLAHSTPPVVRSVS